ncbi:hypothetical protein EYR41_002058 [Orbilia oligospora]|uniref:Uncharacterized protein n=1 Tax=Orbilia oligospora TaxID=2813651 RepID=A0A7C8PBU9_ORBOL|nr:hypothetical protein TWF751_008530 [Orbilia oligospora]TGJ75110.1 hypothetical protein EYR41_002058 [Orbilia oligospora]
MPYPNELGVGPLVENPSSLSLPEDFSPSPLHHPPHKVVEEQNNYEPGLLCLHPCSLGAWLPSVQSDKIRSRSNPANSNILNAFSKMKTPTYNFRSLFSRLGPSKPTTTTTTTAITASKPPAPKKSRSLFSIIKLFYSSRPKHHHAKIRINMDTNLPRVFITADTNDFDPIEIAQWQAEGYEVEYIPRADSHTFELLGDTLESNEKYCIIAYGAAATLALEYALYPVGNLVALIAYYPTGLPSTFPSDDYPKRIRHIFVHVPDAQPFNYDITKKVPLLKYQLYQNTKQGFAEKMTINYNPIAHGLAHTRSLAIVREVLGPNVDLEEIWGEHLLASFVAKKANRTLDSMVKEPYVNHIPTLTGGNGYAELHRFYNEYFIPNNPPSLSLRQISRTVGVDRVVDEMICRFEHTTEISWMLPGVKPTGHTVEIPIVIIACIKAQKVFAEHVYWDQASVLKQIGLVDFTGLPVSGPESAWKLEDRESVAGNFMLGGWDDTLTNDGSATVTEEVTGGRGLP